MKLTNLFVLLGFNIGVPVGPSASVPNMKQSIGDLLSGRAFDNGCTCHLSTEGVFNDLVGRCTQCHCGAPRLKAQFEFVRALLNIGKMLSQLSTKEQRSKFIINSGYISVVLFGFIFCSIHIIAIYFVCMC